MRKTKGLPPAELDAKAIKPENRMSATKTITINSFGARARGKTSAPPSCLGWLLLADRRVKINKAENNAIGTDITSSCRTTMRIFIEKLNTTRVPGESAS